MVTDNKTKTKKNYNFKPGVSGNPGGRPKRTKEELDLVQACKDKTPEALEVLSSLMQVADSDATRMKAAIAIIERGYGKSVQPVDAVLDAKIQFGWMV